MDTTTANPADSLEATITGRGPASTVPDRPDAVDADVYLGGEYLCSVTLLRGHTGGLETWGAPDNWCSDYAAVEALGDGGSGDVVAAVAQAAAHGLEGEG